MVENMQQRWCLTVKIAGGINMEEQQAYVTNLNDMVEFAAQGTVSKTLVDNDKAKIVLFAMVKGQSLSEHTASTPAIIHILRGMARVQLGDELQDTAPGALIYMPPKLPHAVDAQEDLVFLLTLIRG